MVQKTKVLITGASGFIGSHLIDFFQSREDWEIIALVRNNFAGNLNRLKEINFKGPIIWKDLKDKFSVQDFHAIGTVDYILHVAANSHVDRSIVNPRDFVLDNVLGTCNILEYFRTFCYKGRFLYFSTDEVFGPAPPNVAYKEWDHYNSCNPYAATKAGAEELCLAYANTYNLDIIITHTMNVFGERQHPEKFIPLVIDKLKRGEKVQIHADSKRKNPGSRFYIYTKRVCEAIDFLLQHGTKREKYNIVGEKEIDNLTLAETIAEIVGVGLNYELVDFHSSRPGHDLRYALDDSKLKAMGFNYYSTFEEDLERTVKYYV